jgi:purine-cytosine permease-like protein
LLPFLDEDITVSCAVAGNLMLFVYATLLGYISFKTGFNFHLVAKRSFGNKGYIFTSFILSVLVLGWFAVQSDMFGVLLQTTILARLSLFAAKFVKFWKIFEFAKT